MKPPRTLIAVAGALLLAGGCATSPFDSGTGSLRATKTLATGRQAAYMESEKETTPAKAQFSNDVWLGGRPMPLGPHSLDDGGKTYVFALAANAVDGSASEGRSAGARAAESGLPTQPQMIKRGEPIHVALEALAQADGWTLLWYPMVSWKAIADVDLRRYKDAEAAVAEVISILRDEGKPVALRISEGNKVLEVLSTEVKND